MDNYMPILNKVKLFEGLNDKDIISVLNCFDVKIRRFKSGEYVYRISDSVSSIGILLSGGIYVQKEDYWGNLNILAEIRPADLFAEVFACLNNNKITYDVLSYKDSVVMFFDVGRVISMCTSSCPFHALVIQNLLMVLAEKNKKLTQKLSCISQRNIRQKLLYYLASYAENSKREFFEIPFNRQQLADYLSVDRSAMCRELGCMKKEGILDYKKNRFVLYKN